MPTAQELLRRKYQQSVEKLGQAESDYGEQIKTGYLLNGMEGGFGINEQRKMQSEASALKTDLAEGYKLDSDYLKEVEKQQKEQARREKLGNFLKAGATIAGAALALPTGGMSLAGGAALGSTIGEIGNTLYGTGTAPQLDFSFLGDWEDYRNRKKLNTGAINAE